MVTTKKFSLFSLASTQFISVISFVQTDYSRALYAKGSVWAYTNEKKAERGLSMDQTS
jgi:hypothetical protein